MLVGCCGVQLQQLLHTDVRGMPPGVLASTVRDDVLNRVYTVSLIRWYVCLLLTRSIMWCELLHLMPLLNVLTHTNTRTQELQAHTKFSSFVAANEI